MKPSITPAHVRAARALLGWSRDRLAPLADLSVSYLGKFEVGSNTLKPSTLAAIRTALETAGVEFMDENSGGAGARLRTPEISSLEDQAKDGSVALPASGTSRTVISKKQQALASIILNGIKAGASPNEIAAMILDAGYSAAMTEKSL